MPHPADSEFTATYAPCGYCGGLSTCSCPVPSAPMERRLFQVLRTWDDIPLSTYTPTTWLFVLDQPQQEEVA